MILQIRAPLLSPKSVRHSYNSLFKFVFNRIPSSLYFSRKCSQRRDDSTVQTVKATDRAFIVKENCANKIFHLAARSEWKVNRNEHCKCECSAEFIRESLNWLWSSASLGSFCRSFKNWNPSLISKFFVQFTCNAVRSSYFCKVNKISGNLRTTAEFNKFFLQKLHC